MSSRTFRLGGAIALLGLMALVVPNTALAQRPTPNTNQQSPATGKNIEVTVGGAFMTPVSMGSRDIALIAPSGAPLVLAGTSSRTGASFGVEARLGFRATDRMRFEVMGGLSRVNFETSVSNDNDLNSGSAAQSATASLPVNRFTAGGAVTFNLVQKHKRDIYAIGGVAWMRELSELSAAGVYDDGAIVDGGAGLKMWWRDRATGRIKRLGLRVEGRLGVRTGGLNLDEKSAHVVPTFVASMIIGS